MNADAQDLIEKIAGGKFRFNKATFSTRAARDKARRSQMGYIPEIAVGTAAAGTAAAGYGAYRAGKAIHGKLTGKKDDEKKEEPVKDTEKKSSMKNIIDDIIKGAEQNSFGRPVTIQTNLDKSASELIQKMAAGPYKLNRASFPTAAARAEARGTSDQFVRAQQMRGASKEVGKRYGLTGKDVRKDVGGLRDVAKEEIKKGELTPLDIAKTAGALQALGEQGYSVKDASEYLRLTEAQIQYIVDTVR